MALEIGGKRGKVGGCSWQRMIWGIVHRSQQNNGSSSIISLSVVYYHLKHGLLLLLFKYFASSKHVLDNSGDCAYIANVTVQTDLQTLHLQNYADSFVLITKPQALHLTQQYKYFKAIETPQMAPLNKCL